MIEQSKTNKLICKLAYKSSKAFDENADRIFCVLGLFCYILMMFEFVGFVLRSPPFQNLTSVMCIETSVMLFCTGSICILAHDTSIRNRFFNRLDESVAIVLLSAFLFAGIVLIDMLVGIIVGSILFTVISFVDYRLVRYIHDNCPKFKISG